MAAVGFYDFCRADRLSDNGRVRDSKRGTRERKPLGAEGIELLCRGGLIRGWPSRTFVVETTANLLDRIRPTVASTKIRRRDVEKNRRIIGTRAHALCDNGIIRGASSVLPKPSHVVLVFERNNTVRLCRACDNTRVGVGVFAGESCYGRYHR